MTEGGGLCDMEFSDNESDDPLPQSGTGKSLKRLPTSEDISSDEESITGKKPPLKKLTVITPLPLPCPTPSPSPSPVPSPVPSPAPLPVPSPVPSPVPKHSTSVPRVRTYPAIASSVGPWIVFFRTKPNGKSLNVVQIMTDLRRYASVSEIAKVRPDKLRVVVGDRKHANSIVIDEHFIREYRVYIPCSEVEIQGVVTESSLNCETIKKDGYGIFKKLPSVMVDIVDCCQLGTVSNQQGKNVFTTSDSFRVTFSGSALPDYVVIDKLRLPVRLFVPKPMTCDKCKSVGHTAAYCSNKARCSTCGNRHEGKPCTAPEPKCPYCGGTPHELSACNAYTKNRDKLKRTIKERSKRSFAKILKNASPPDPPPIVSANAFATLPDEEVVADSTNAGTPFVLEGKHRRKNPTTPVVQEQVASVQASTTTDKKATAKEKKNQIPPGFQRGGSPPKPAPKSPTAPASSTSQTTLFKFSDIVDGIFTFFDVSDSTRTIIAAILPVVKALLHQLLQKWPLLAMIISLDD